MPVRNEERHLAESVRHVLGQEYPGELELVLAVGPSADRTEELARELAAAHPRVTVVANPTGKIPAALNAAVRAARHQVIARVDGHALLPPGYLTTAVAALIETGAADVGGIMAAEGVTAFARAVAWGMTSKAGVGSAAFHTGGGAGPADSVYLGYEEKYSQDDYYTEKQRVVGQWFGRGAEELGLSGEVATEDFRAVLRGLRPASGEVLVHKANGYEDRRAGWDATFNAPKSVSIQGLVGDDHRLIEAHRKAVSRALGGTRTICALAPPRRQRMGRDQQCRRRALRSHRRSARQRS